MSRYYGYGPSRVLSSYLSSFLSLKDEQTTEFDDLSLSYINVKKDIPSGIDVCFHSIIRVFNRYPL